LLPPVHSIVLGSTVKDAESGSQPPDQYETAIRLLRQVQSDYHHAREQLQEVSARFGDREALASRQLREAVDSMDQVKSGTAYVPVGGAAPGPTCQHGLGEQSVLLRPVDLTSATMEVCCLGPFQVRICFKKVQEWHSTKAKSVLKYLVTHSGRPISRDTLMEALWPESEPTLANNNLKAAIRSLRQTLALAHGADQEFPWILFQEGSYMINPEADLWTDMEQFEFHWRAARQLEKDCRPVEAIGQHELAEALYRGEYLQDDPYEEWTTLRREALKDTYLAILGKLADHSIHSDDYEGCIVYCQKILNKDPCREDAYRRLMCSYSRLGNRNRAIGWYKLCERTVRAELDVDPDDQTVELYQRLIRDKSI